MQTSLRISANYRKRSEKASLGQTSVGSSKNKRSPYLFISGGLITLPIVMSWSLLQWVVKQNWTMLPL